VLRRLPSRTSIRLLAVLPPPLLGVAGAITVGAGIVLLCRIVDLVRHPEEVTRRRRDVAHFQEWTPEARVSYVREQRQWSLGLLAVGAVLLVVAIGRA
jgi:hypothetical protein